MPIRAVVYVSSASQDHYGDEQGLRRKLDQVVDDAARFNRKAGVTGVLLFDGERFLQYLEGPEDGLSVAYSRVIGASSHTGLIELQRGRVGQRRLPFWPMKWIPAEPEDLRRLVRADWTWFNQGRDAQDATPWAMNILANLVEPHTLAP